MPKTRKSLKAKADRVFSLYIRSQGACEWCLRTKDQVQLQCAHIFSRRYLSTRYSPTNVLCLCAACHRKAHDQPIEFAEFCKKHLGEDIYNELRYEARVKIGKPDYEAIISKYEAL